MSFPQYPEYRDSGVVWLGDVPAHWNVLRLKRVASALPSNVDKKTVHGEVPVVLCNYTDVYYNDRIVEGMPFMAASATEEQVERFTLRRGDVIITKDSETADDIAVAAHVPEDLPGVVCGYHLTMIRAQRGTGGLFLKWLFGSRYLRARFEVAAKGLTRVGLGQYVVENVDLPAPPEAEQHAIAAFLDRETARIDSLVAEQGRLIELLREKRQVVISHAVTKGLDPNVPMKDSGVEWLGEVPGHWNVLRLKRVASALPSNIDKKTVDGEVPVVLCNYTDVYYNDRIVQGMPFMAASATEEQVERFTLRRGDVIITKDSETADDIAVAAYVPEDLPGVVCGYHLTMIRARRGNNGSFLKWLFGSRYLRARFEVAANGLTRVGLGQYAVENVGLPVPPEAEQHAVAAFLDRETARIDTLITEAERAIALLRERRSALISAAVTGQIDVRGHIEVQQ